jgi:hypothetical protein
MTPEDDREPEPLPKTWPPAPLGESSFVDLPKPRMLTGRVGRDKAVGWAGAYALGCACIKAGRSWTNFLDASLYHAGTAVYLFPRFYWLPLLLVPIGITLAIAGLLYLIVRRSYPIIARSFGQAWLLAIGIGVATGLAVHFFP